MPTKNHETVERCLLPNSHLFSSDSSLYSNFSMMSALWPLKTKALKVRFSENLLLLS